MSCIFNYRVTYHQFHLFLVDVLSIHLIQIHPKHAWCEITLNMMIFTLTWRKLTVPNGVWIGCICGSSVSNICWIRDSLLSSGLCHDTWSPLQNVFSVEEWTKGHIHFQTIKKICIEFTLFHDCLSAQCIWACAFNHQWEGVVLSHISLSDSTELLKKSYNNRKRGPTDKQDNE